MKMHIFANKCIVYGDCQQNFTDTLVGYRSLNVAGDEIFHSPCSSICQLLDAELEDGAGYFVFAVFVDITDLLPLTYHMVCNLICSIFPLFLHAHDIPCCDFS
jgi:hypothetical protein